MVVVEDEIAFNKHIHRINKVEGQVILIISPLSFTTRYVLHSVFTRFALSIPETHNSRQIHLLRRRIVRVFKLSAPN
jgi:hypothetical protein